MKRKRILCMVLTLSAVLALLCVPALLKGKLSRWQGVVLLAIYAGFTVFQFLF